MKPLLIRLGGGDHYEREHINRPPNPCLREAYIPVSGENQQKMFHSVSGDGQAVEEIKQRRVRRKSEDPT